MTAGPAASAIDPRSLPQGPRSGFIGIFGGSFNPPHISHVLALAVVHARFDPKKLLVIPTYQHPFAKALAPYEDRVKMCELAMGWVPNVEVSRVEEELGGESRTLRTIEHLRKKYPGTPLRLIVGGDILIEAGKWFGFEQIAELAPLIVLGRVGISFEGSPPAVLPEISSTEVRTRLADPNADLSAVEPLVPHEVIEYARAKKLYG